MAVQEIISFLSTIFLVIFQINQLTVNAGIISRTITQTVRLEEKDWFHHLLNPCNHDNPENHAHSQEILRVSGRETEIRTIVGTTLARLRSIEEYLSGPISSCPLELETLPPLPPSNMTTFDTEEDTEILMQVYNSSLHLAAHFKYMAEDWNDGIICNDDAQIKTTLVDAFNKQGDFFGQVMCTLMAPVNPSAVPIPSENMKRNIYDLAKNTEPHHHKGSCNHRTARDCTVYKYAKSYLQTLLTAVSTS